MTTGRPPLAVMALRTMGARYLIYGIGTIGSIILARSLEASGRGAYAYVTTLSLSILAVSHLSVEHALLSAWSAEDRRRLTGTALALGVGVGVLAIAVTAAGLAVFDITLPEGTQPWMVYTAVATIPLLLVALYADAALINEGLLGTVNFSELLMTAVRVTAFASAAAAAVLGIGLAIAIWAATMPLLFLAKVPTLIRAVGVERPSLQMAFGIVGKGIRFHLGALSLALILRVDILLLATRVDVAEVGRYALAVTLVELALRAGEGSSQVAVHRLIRSDQATSARLTSRVARLNALMAFALVVPIVVFGPVLIVAVFGASFAGTTPAVAALAPGVIALGLERPLGAFIVRLNKPGLLSAGLFLGLVVNVALNLLLIPIWGIIGAAIASSVIYVGLAGWLGAWFLRSGELAAAELVPRPSDVIDVVTAIRRRGPSR